MATTRAAALAIVLLASTSVMAADVPGVESPAPVLKPGETSEIQAHIAALGSKDYRVREKAGQALAAQGQRARPALKAALATTEQPEVVQRLETLLYQMNSERFTKPTLVTLNLKNATVKTAFRELSQVSGYEIKCTSSGWTDRITLDMVDRPFWEVVGKIESQCGANLIPGEDAKQHFQVIQTDALNPHVSYSGPFRFTTTNIHSSKRIQLGSIPRRGYVPASEDISMFVVIQCEPKAPLLHVGAIKLAKATDDKGTSMLQAKNDDPGFGMGFGGGGVFREGCRHYSRGTTHQIGFTLIRGDRAATLIKEIEGKVDTVLLDEERVEISIDKPLEAANKKFAGKTVDLEMNKIKYAEADGSVAMTLTFHDRQHHEDFSDGSWSSGLVGLLKLTDDFGRPYALNNVDRQRWDGPGSEGTIQFQLSYTPQTMVKPRPPAKLQLMQLLERKQEVPFSFKNIPLP